MIKNICYIYITPPIKNFESKHGWKEMYRKGYDIFIYDISPIVNLIAYKSVKKDLIKEGEYNLKRFYVKKEVEDYISSFNHVETLFIPYFDFYLDVLFIYKLFNSNNSHFGIMHRANAEIKAFKMNKKIVYDYIKHISLKKIINSILIRIPKDKLYLKKADFMVFGGKENMDFYKSINLVDKNTKNILIHALQFEECLNAKDYIEDFDIKDKNYAVFLDQYIPYHPDHIELGLYIPAKQYYDEINKLFSIIEQAIDIEIVIAAHPKADIEKYTEVFQGKKIIKFHTPDLIKNSKLVIANFSTAISYAVYFRKKLIIANSDLYNEYPYFRERVKYWSQQTGIESINLTSCTTEQIKDKIQNTEVNCEKYLQCIQNTLKANFEWDREYSESFWDILEKEIIYVEEL